MKFVKITLSVALLGLLSIASAEDTTILDTTTTVDAQIEAIQTAPAQERVRLMNQFKLRLMEMNELERSEAIEKLQTRSQTQTMEQTRTRTREHTQEMQMQTNEEAIRTQTMTQQRAGSQLMHTSGGINPNLNTNMMRGR